MVASDIESIAKRLERIESKLDKSDKQQRRQQRRLGVLITTSEAQAFGIDALLCGVCVGAVAIFAAHNYFKESIINNAPSWVTQTFFPHFVDQSVGPVMGFDGLKIEAPYLLDESPPGSYDFTLIDPSTDSDRVDVPAPCQGKITESGMQGGYGNAVALLCTDGIELFMAHFESLDVQQGMTVAKGQSLGIQGSTGNSTGPHVHLEVTLPGKAMRDRSVTRPYVEDVLFPFWREGLTVERGTFGALTDEEIICAIGESEGTRDSSCRPNSSYYGHTDPGNGASNIGTFSYQGNASTPEQADEIWLHKLRANEYTFRQQSLAKFGKEPSKAVMIAALDLYTQSPLAAGDFIGHLNTHNPSVEEIIRARVKSYVNPDTGNLDAPGLGNDPQRVWDDQQRRTEELLEVIQ